MKIIVGTDGACAGNPGPGGWGWVTADGARKGYGAAKHTTNQQMEIMAAARALHGLGQEPGYRKATEIIVKSDSRYVVDCMEKKWYVGWQRREWKTAGGDPVKNQELWEKLLRWKAAWEKRGVKVTFQWVKGHSGDPLNDAADALAVKGREEARSL